MGGEIGPHGLSFWRMVSLSLSPPSREAETASKLLPVDEYYPLKAIIALLRTGCLPQKRGGVPPVLTNLSDWNFGRGLEDLKWIFSFSFQEQSDITFTSHEANEF